MTAALGVRTKRVATGAGARRSRGIRAVLALGTVVGIGTTLTLAAWTDNGTAESTFTTGTVDLQLNDTEGKPTPYAFTALNMTGVGAGSTTYGNLTVRNNGTLAFGYTMATSAGASTSTDLYDALRVSVKVLPATTCSASTYAAGTATPLLDTVALSAASIASRPLAAAGTENLCFKVDLPTTAPDAAQGTSAVVDFAFTATQS